MPAARAIPQSNSPLAAVLHALQNVPQAASASLRQQAKDAAAHLLAALAPAQPALEPPEISQGEEESGDEDGPPL